MRIKTCTIAGVRYVLARPHSRRCVWVKSGNHPHNRPWLYRGTLGKEELKAQGAGGWVGGSDWWHLYRCPDCGALLFVAAWSVAIGLPPELEEKR